MSLWRSSMRLSLYFWILLPCRGLKPTHCPFCVPLTQGLLILNQCFLHWLTCAMTCMRCALVQLKHDWMKFVGCRLLSGISRDPHRDQLHLRMLVQVTLARIIFPWQGTSLPLCSLSSNNCQQAWRAIVAVWFLPQLRVLRWSSMRCTVFRRNKFLSRIQCLEHSTPYLRVSSVNISLRHFSKTLIWQKPHTA